VAVEVGKCRHGSSTARTERAPPRSFMVHDEEKRREDRPTTVRESTETRADEARRKALGPLAPASSGRSGSGLGRDVFRVRTVSTFLRFWLPARNDETTETAKPRNVGLWSAIMIQMRSILGRPPTISGGGRKIAVIKPHWVGRPGTLRPSGATVPSPPR